MKARAHALTRSLACALACLAAYGCKQSDVVVARIQPLDAGSGGAGGAAGRGASTAGNGGVIAGSGGASGAAGMPADPCALKPYYDELSYVVSNGCRVPDSQRGTLDRIASFLMESPMPPAEGEERPPEPCDFGGLFFFEDPNAPGEYVLCAPACEWVSNLAAREYERHVACLEASGRTP